VSVPLMEIIDPAYLKAQLARLDVDLSTRASEATLAGIKGQTDKLAFDTASRLYVNAAVIANPPNLDVALSTRASEATLSGIKGQTDKLSFDSSNRLYTNAAVVANPSNLDVALSTRLSESTFTARVPTLNTISADLAGGSRALLTVVPSGSPMDLTRQPTYNEVGASTTESSVAFAAPGLKLAIIINRGDSDVLIRINSSTGTQIRIPARTGLVFGFAGITAIYYVTSAGASTLVIKGFS